MMEDREFSSEGLQWLYDRFIGDDPESVSQFKEYEVKAEIAKQVYTLRDELGWTQSQMADFVGVEESLIRSLEEADYRGDSLAMLVRIAAALHKRVEVRVVPSAWVADTSA